MLEIDGSTGEGGGQIVRSSLTLSLATGRPVRLYNIRAGRKRPGLLRQHLTAVAAAAAVGKADVRGATLKSRELTFRPRPITAGEYRFDVGTAGSATLVLQTVLPVLLTASGSSHLTLEGGTHNPSAPPFDFLEKAFLPLLCRLGPRVTATLERPGYFPAGGGKFRVDVEPSVRLKRLELMERGPIAACRAWAVVSQLPLHIARRELSVIGRELSLTKENLQAVEEVRSRGPGNVVHVEVEAANLTELFTGFGERRVRAEVVAERVAAEVSGYLQAGVPVGPRLADQLLLPLTLGSGGTFRTMTPTTHTLTNIEVIRRFLPVRIELTEETAGNVVIDVRTK